LFAPHYHPAMKAIAPVRAALGVRTIFNILGPLTNPAEPPFHLIGAFSLDVARLIAQTIAGMPMERTFVVHGAEGWDEPTPIGPFTVFDVRPGRVEVGMRRPEDYGLGPCKAADLAGGDARENAAALRAVLEGKDKGPHRDCLLLGTALALEVAGKVHHPREGVERAVHAIESGAARRVLEALANFKVGAGSDRAPSWIVTGVDRVPAGGGVGADRAAVGIGAAGSDAVGADVSTGVAPAPVTGVAR
jgi:anthranilate phosphoribosyltransferase